MFLIKVKCDECTRENYVKVVDNRAFCPYCKRHYDVALETRGLVCGKYTHGNHNNYTRATGKSSEIEGDK